MNDPRIRRTKDHVLAAAERLMIKTDPEPITYTSLARESTVSRRTIYIHWPTIDAIFADILARRLTDRFSDLSELTLGERLTRFLESLRAGLDDPVESTALLAVVLDASRTHEADARMHDIAAERLQLFRAHVGSISPENFALLVGPFFTTALVLRQPVSDTLVAAQVAFGMSVMA